MPLPERIDACRAIGNLEVSSVEAAGKGKLVHFVPSLKDMAMFREGDPVRLSLNDPDGDPVIKGTFLGLDGKGLAVWVPREADLGVSRGWTLDEEMIDLSDFYLRALSELASTAHGRDVVLPTLLNGDGDEINLEDQLSFPTNWKIPDWTRPKWTAWRIVWRHPAST